MCIMASCGLKKEEFVKSFPLKETEYIAEDFKAEITHTLFDIM